MPNATQLDELKQLLAQGVGLHVAPNANAKFAGMMRERAARLGYATLDEYRAFLAGDKTAQEWEDIVRALTSTETYFFRDQGQFDLLRLNLLPELMARQQHKKTLRIWSAGCASGEEAYSLAILVDMLLPDRNDWEIRIFGTDIDSLAIARAKQGLYRQWSFRMVPAALQQRYFRQTGAEWAIDDRIRRMVTFGVSNLVHADAPDFVPPLYDMDLILCRNVFIYFDPAAVSAVAGKLASRLTEGGYLMTAHTELMGYPALELESRLFTSGVVYQRRTQAPATLALLPAPPAAADRIAHPASPQDAATPVAQPEAARAAIKYGASARALADQGEYDLAERMCRSALAADPLAASPYFLLAQLAEIKGDYRRARDCLDKAIYLDHRYVAAYLELAALHEREGNGQRAESLRHTALQIVRAMPGDKPIEHIETTAGDLAQWLAQLGSTAERHAGANGGHAAGEPHGQ